ncbi:hypothetical protein LWI29_005411 [Acer saccharum]|uniref:Reverse transcriptase Ty1/copia-type domain-containing protein n=1 Tax=Acer saccharum TaxID=4024 RepID=A0AA39VFG9_ACESA|nr:hypothetical protein LWI29_005411 [Acer saccharum]
MLSSTRTETQRRLSRENQNILGQMMYRVVKLWNVVVIKKLKSNVCSPGSPQAYSTPRRSTRPHVPNKRYLHYLLLTDAGEPEYYDKACQGEDASKWELAMKDEMKSLVSNQTWELTELPKGKKTLQNKWVFRIKEEHDGSKRYKTRLVVKGFQQKKGIDYTDIFSPVVKLTTIRLGLSIVAAKGLYLKQLDMKTAFLHGDLEEEIYMQQPKGFMEQGRERWFVG